MTDVHYAAVQPLSNGDDQGYCAKMRIRVLGPVEVVSDGVDVRLGGPKQRTILALLVAEVGKVVSVDALIDGLWGEDPTPGARSTLHTYISNLRTALGDVIVREGGGYRLHANPQQVDAVQFEQAVVHATKIAGTQPVEGAQRLTAALALWRGHPYADASESFPLDLAARRLEEIPDRLEVVGAGILDIVAVALRHVADARGHIGRSVAAVTESPLANSVTSWPNSTSPSTSQATTRSVPPYNLGGTASVSGATCAMRIFTSPVWNVG